MEITEKLVEEIVGLAGDEGFWDDDNRDKLLSIAQYLKSTGGMSEPDIFSLISDIWDAVEDEVSC